MELRLSVNGILKYLLMKGHCDKQTNKQTNKPVATG
jgi:hypothetical protein